MTNSSNLAARSIPATSEKVNFPFLIKLRINIINKMSSTLVRAGDELNFFGDSTKSTKLTTKTNSFRYVPSDTIGTSKCVATRTGTL